MTKASIKQSQGQTRSSELGLARSFLQLLASGGLILALNATPACAQYRAIPDYIGIGAGQQFRNDINNHLSGVTPIAPRLVGLRFAQLPAEQNGQLYWCQDCVKETPCRAGGSGALAMGQDGVWTCGGYVPLSSSLNANSNRLVNIAPNQTSGDALSQGQSHLNDLTGATAPYDMGGNKLQGLKPNSAVGDALSQGQSSLNDLAKATATYDMGSNKLQNLSPAASSGDALSFGQTGGQLNGLDLNNKQLSSLSPSSSAGQALAFGQNGAQLKITSGTIAVRSRSPNVASGSPLTSQAIGTPAGLADGDVEIATLHFSASGGTASNFVAPAGWTHIRHDSSAAGPGGETVTMGLWWHCVNSAATEPANYTWSWTNPSYIIGNILDLTGVNCTNPVDASAGGTAAGGSALTNITVGGATPMNQGDFILGIIRQYTSNRGAAPNRPITTQLNYTANGTLIFSFPWSNGPIPSWSAAGTALTSMAASEVVIIPAATTQAVPAIARAPAGLSSQVASGTINYSTALNALTGYSAGNFNAISYGADPTKGPSDSALAINAAIRAACLAPNSAGHKVHLPGGYYNILSPIVLMCANGEFLDLAGDGQDGTTIGSGMFAGPAIVVANSALLTSLGGVATLLQPPLVGSIGNSLNWGSGPSPFILDLRELLSAQALNGMGQIDVRGFFKLAGTPNYQGIIFSDGSAEPTKLTGTNCPYASDGYPTCAGGGAFGLFIGTDAKLHLHAKVGGTQYVRSGGTIVDGGSYEFEYAYDGSKVSLYVGPVGGTITQLASQAATGTVNQRPDENMVIGSFMACWPIQCPGDPAHFFAGQLYGIEIANSARHSSNIPSYVADSTGFPGDSHSLFLLNLDLPNGNFPNGYPILAPDYVNGHQNTGGIQSSWMTVHNEGLGQSVGPYEVHDLAIASGTDGIIGANVELDAQRLNIGTASGLTHTGIQTSPNGSFNSFVRDVRINADLPLYLAGGLTNIQNFQLTCGFACGVFNSLAVIHCYVNPQSITKFYLMGNGANATTSFEDINIDSETGSSANCLLLAPIIYDSGFRIKNVSCNSALAPVKLDSYSSGGVTQSTKTTNISIEDSNFTGLGGVPVVDASASLLSNIRNGVLFKNNTFNGIAAPPGGWVSNGIPYSVLGGAMPQFGFVPGFNAGLNHLSVNTVSDPAAPAISVVGLTGSTSYGPYYVVCHDANGGTSNVSPSSNTIVNGPASLSQTSFIQVAWSAQTPCVAWDVLKSNATTAIATGLPGSTTSLGDTGQSTSSYKPPGRNTGDVVLGGMVISSGMNWPLPANVVNGASFYCRNCDPPANPPVTCTSTGPRTGAWVHGLNSQWLCTP